MNGRRVDRLIYYGSQVEGRWWEDWRSRGSRAEEKRSVGGGRRWLERREEGGDGKRRGEEDLLMGK